MSHSESNLILAGDSHNSWFSNLYDENEEFVGVIEGVNYIKRHSKPSQQNQQGGIIEREASLHISSVMLVVSGNKTKVGYRFLDNGKKVRFSKKTNEDIDS